MRPSKHVQTLLMKALDELCAKPELYAMKPGIDFTRNRKLSLKDLILLYITMEDDTTKEELFRYFGRKVSTPKPYVLHKQRKKLAKDTFKNLLIIFNNLLPVELLNKKYRCIAVDGSNITMFRDCKDKETYLNPSLASARGFNQFHLNAAYDVINNRYIDFVFQSIPQQNEHLAFCEMLKNYAKSNTTKAIFLADRGYEAYNNYATAIENNQYFLIRCDDKLFKSYTGIDPSSNTGESDLDITLFLTRSMAKNNWLHPDKAECYRKIAKHTKFEYLDDEKTEYELNIRVIRLLIKDGIYENIVTNLPKNEFQLKDIKKLYKDRWNIETSFRFLKHTLCINALHAKKYDNAIHEIWARAIMYNITSAITSAVSKDKEYKDCKPEYTNAINTCRDFIRGKSPYPIEVEKLINDNLTDIVENRKFIRYKCRESLTCFCYR